MMPDPSMMGMPPQPGGPMGMGPDPMMMAPQPQQEPQVPPTQEEETGPDFEAILDAALSESNLAKNVDDATLTEIADQVLAGYEEDKASCQQWLENNKKWLSLALLLSKEKSFPWKGASNVKYPLIATAAMQFTARSYPTLVPADGQIVKPRVIGFDQDGTQADRAERIAKHMSYQIMYQMPSWEEDMDKLLLIEAIMGVCFKKTYKDPVLNTVVSTLVFPENLIVNYGARTLESAYRKTEILYLTHNEYETKVREGEFLDLKLDKKAQPSVETVSETPQAEKPTANDLALPSRADASTPHVFYAQHTFYDLDNDGYEEPVVIVVHKETNKVARILPRWESSGVRYAGTGKNKKIAYIAPLEYFTDFQFIPNPDGSIYGLGFGSLLGPINEAVNSSINQLIDAGTLNNLQSGFLAKGLRVQMKEQSFAPGEWKEINATTEDLKNSIFPLPTKEPSSVLFNLMNLLIQSGNQLASVAEIFVGKMPGQNTPATTTQETVDQAMKVFTSIYKRNYRALLKEFQKIYNWNRLSPEMVVEQASVLNLQLTASDYAGPIDDILPAADPSGSSNSTQFQKLNMIMQNQVVMANVNPQEITKRLLKLIEIPDPDALVSMQPPPPDPKIQTEQLKQQGLQQKQELDAQAKQQDLEMKKQIAELESAVKRMELQFKAQELQLKLAGQKQKMQMDTVQQVTNQRQQAQQAQFDMGMKQRTAELDYKTREASNKQKLNQQKQTSAQKEAQNKRKEKK